jgi:hypothetical protein
MGVQLSDYNIKCWALRSWVIEGSLDGAPWTEIDRRTNIQGFNDPSWITRSFPVATSMACRFTGLTQPDQNHNGDWRLFLEAGEFFGTLYE